MDKVIKIKGVRWLVGTITLAFILLPLSCISPRQVHEEDLQRRIDALSTTAGSKISREKVIQSLNLSAVTSKRVLTGMRGGGSRLIERWSINDSLCIVGVQFTKGTVLEETLSNGAVYIDHPNLSMIEKEPVPPVDFSLVYIETRQASKDPNGVTIKTSINNKAK